MQAQSKIELALIDIGIIGARRAAALRVYSIIIDSTGATHSRTDLKDTESFRLPQDVEKKKKGTRCDTCPGNVGPKSLARRRAAREETARRAAGKPAIIRWSNYHKKGSNFTQCSLFFSPGRITADRDRTGCTWPRKVARVSIDFHDFSISFSMAPKGTSPSVRPLRLLCDKNLIRRDEALDGGDQPFIKCARSAPCVTLFVPSAASFRE